MNLNHFPGTFIEKKERAANIFLFRIIKLDIHQNILCHKMKLETFSQYVRIDKVMCTVCGYYSHTLHC